MVHTETKPLSSLSPEEREANRIQAEQEAKNVEQYCASTIRSSETLAPEMKAYLEAYVKENPEQWRCCDGVNLKPDGFSKDLDHRLIVAYFMSYEYDENGDPLPGFPMEVTDEIPMPEWMKE